jgi:hypothetical protein
MGATVSPVRSAQVTKFVGVPTIVLAETIGPDLCSPGAAMSAFGDYLNIYVCTKDAGSYPLSGFVPTCPSSSGGAVFGLDQGGSTTLFKATAGTLEIASADATCVQGSFDITFDSGDSTTGTFRAAVCP